ncbi:MAG: hypothetical protein ABW252_25720 [Polyangiales bacterium]
MLAFEARWVRIILASFAPVAGPALSPCEGEVDYEATFAGMRASAGPLARLGMRLALWLVALAPMWYARRRGTMSNQPLAVRQALLAALLDHRAYAVRESALMLKLAASVALFASDAVRARSDYDGVVPANDAAPEVPVTRLRRSAS